MILKPAILLVLRGMAGAPTTDAALLMAVRMSFPNAIDTEIRDAVRNLEQNGCVAGVRDEILDTITWTLTQKGQHAARVL
jgi:hypothetical protein